MIWVDYLLSAMRCKGISLTTNGNFTYNQGNTHQLIYPTSVSQTEFLLWYEHSLTCWANELVTYIFRVITEESVKHDCKSLWCEYKQPIYDTCTKA